ncbi:MAG: SAM-dependent methyltransferase [Candidatus Nephthysia bennettiae]|nr:MAG: SAM-dependent methyltransferase [Candidatus Dormibacteraeota bacterium]
MSSPAPEPAGHTATLAAVGRAIHLSSTHPRLVEDHLALDLAGEAGAALMGQLKRQLPADSLEGLGLAFAIRVRFVEDAVERALQAGGSQYVILGAGLDSFAYRRADLMPHLRVFEVDLPEPQAWKRKRLTELGVDLPPRLIFIPVDLEAEHLNLRKELVRAGFNPSAPAMISWVAVTQYLRQEAITDTLSSLAALPAGTQLLLTYVVPPDGLTEMEKAGLAWTMKQAADRGEPFLSLFYPQEAEDLLMEEGFTRVEHFGPEELRQLYLKDRPNAPISGIERLAIGSR